MTKFIKHENLDELSDELIDKILQVNVRSIAMMRNFLFVKKSKNPTVINISSIAAVTGMGSNNAIASRQLLII